MRLYDEEQIFSARNILNLSELWQAAKMCLQKFPLEELSHWEQWLKTASSQ